MGDVQCLELLIEYFACVSSVAGGFGSALGSCGLPYLTAYRFFVSLRIADLLSCSRKLNCSKHDQIYEAADNRAGKRQEGMVDLEGRTPNNKNVSRCKKQPTAAHDFQHNQPGANATFSP